LIAVRKDYDSSITSSRYCQWAQLGLNAKLAQEPITVQRKLALVIGNQRYPDAPLR